MKTTTPASEVQQIRLGLGQVLEYRTTLVTQGWRVKAHLVTELSEHSRVADACHAVGVTLHTRDELDRLARAK